MLIKRQNASANTTLSGLKTPVAIDTTDITAESMLISLPDFRVTDLLSTRDPDVLIASRVINYRAAQQLQQRSRPSRPQYLHPLRSV